MVQGEPPEPLGECTDAGRWLEVDERGELLAEIREDRRTDRRDQAASRWPGIKRPSGRPRAWFVLRRVVELRGFEPLTF